MTLLRAAARTMLASYFVVHGVKAVRNPAALVPDAEPLVDRVVPLVKQYAPEQVADQIPDDTATLVRIHGAVQLLGGLALATGKGRRLGALLLAGSLIPSTVAKHPFWSRTTPEEKAIDREHFLKNVSLLGGILLAARDTEGRPSLAWRAHKGGQSLARSSRRTTKKLTKSGNDLTDEAKELAESAVASGALLLGTVAATGRKARKQSAKQFKQAKKVARKQLEEAKTAAAAAAKQARKDGRRLAKQAGRRAAEVKKNIHLGEN
jgi:uncharacterized membrane protein YphA (DoxX/SURF4 family)